MNYLPIIHRADKGVLRFDWGTGHWRWVRSGPYLLVAELETGEWRVNRRKLW